MEFARIWLPLLAIVINALLAWVGWSVKRGLVSKDEHHARRRRGWRQSIRAWRGAFIGVKTDGQKKHH